MKGLRLRLCLICLFSSGCVVFAERSVVVPERAGMNPFGPLAAGVVLEEEFRSDGRPFDRILILLATYARLNRSTLEAVRERESERGWIPVGRLSIRSLLVNDNMFHEFPFPRQAPQPGERFRLRLSSPDARDATALTAWVAPPPAPPGVALLRNGVRVEGAIPLTLMDRERRPFTAGVRESQARLRGVVPGLLFVAAGVAAVAFPLLALALLARLSLFARRSGVSRAVRSVATKRI